MIRYLQHTEIDKTKWDACIESSINGNIYGFSRYLDSACERWDALIDDDYKFIMPLPFRKKLGFYYIFPPSLIQQLGVFSPFEISASKVAEFIQAIPSKFKYAEIFLNHYNPVENLNIRQKTHINLELDLNKPYSEIAASYSENLRRNLKKIPDNFFRIQKDGNIEQLINLFKSNQAKKIETLPKDFYSVLIKISASSKQKLWQLYIEEELCAGVLFVFGCKKAVFLFSASNSKAKEHYAMHYLVDSFIRENAQTPLTLDFEGSDNETLARFYKSFGATEKNYTVIQVSKFPDYIINLIKSLLKIKKKLH